MKKKYEHHIFSVRLDKKELEFVDSLREKGDSRNKGVRRAIQVAMKEMPLNVVKISASDELFN
jgi:metal-responsive CopG/Arc/MetJ family transcriptional regulator